MAKATKNTVSKGESKAVSSEKGGELQSVTPGRALSPFEEMDRMFEQMERRFEDFFSRGWLRPFGWERPSFRELGAPFEGRFPREDVVDRDDEIVVRAELPGVEKKDLDVSVTENTVTIKGSSRREEKEVKGNYYRSEISTGTFSRTVALPADVDGAKGKAAFKDGVLELVMPKVEKSKRRTIRVQ